MASSSPPCSRSAEDHRPQAGGQAGHATASDRKVHPRKNCLNGGQGFPGLLRVGGTIILGRWELGSIIMVRASFICICLFSETGSTESFAALHLHQSGMAALACTWKAWYTCWGHGRGRSSSQIATSASSTSTSELKWGRVC